MLVGNILRWFSQVQNLLHRVGQSKLQSLKDSKAPTSKYAFIFQLLLATSSQAATLTILQSISLRAHGEHTNISPLYRMK